jgi:hypothetical protein
MQTLVGAGAPPSAANQYSTIILNQSFRSSPVQMVMDSFSPVTGAVSVTVTMHSTTFALAGDSLHIVLTEDDIAGDNTEVTRLLYSDTISLTGAGNTETITHSFTIDPTWDNTKLRAIAFIQLADQEIIQAASSEVLPTYKIRALVPFSRTVLGPSTGVYESDFLTVMNTGLGDDFEVSIVIDDAPPGWSVAFKDSVGTTHTDPLVFSLAADASTTFKAIATPGSPGFMRYRVVFNSPNLTRSLEIPFTYITDDVDVLIVDDDGGDTFEDYFREALEAGGKSYGVWNTSSDPLTQEVADTFNVLVWNVGFSSPTLDTADKAFLADFLDDGKALFLSGQDIGWDLNENNPDVVWYHSYLHATYIRDDTNIYNIFGVSGDPITDGLDLIIQGGTGANNQDYPDEIEPYDADATMILNYQGNYGAAIRSTDSVTGAKVVYTGFGFEGIADAQDRHDLLVPAVRWLQGVVFEDGFESGTTGAWSSSSP